MALTTRIVDTETGAPVEDALYTPYACAKVVNEQLTELGRPAGLPGQMFYNYVKQGMLATVEVELPSGKVQKLVKESVLATWLVGYLERKDKAAAKKMTAAAQA
jgi:hypothetical protein